MAKKKITLVQEFVKGLWDQNPVIVALLGLCPVLAVTVSAVNGLAMGLATTFVLTTASILISIFRQLIPAQVRIASYIVIIATAVTVADRFLAAFFPDISSSLGPYIPLIIANCLILGRQEAFASKNGPGRSTIDALGMGVGFTAVLVVLGGIREIIGSKMIFGITILPQMFEPWLVMILPAGAFLTLGFLIALANWINEKRGATA